MNKLVAFFGLVVLIPLLIFVALAILLFDRQSPFFFQKRVGIHKSIFTIYKFQTFKNGQISVLGKVLRKTGVDEIPQLINILKNDINFIGPRPLTSSDIERLGWGSSYYQSRWSVKPGLTGLAQLSPKCHKKMTLFWDNYYAKHQSFKMDVKIITATFFILFFGKNKVINYIYKK
ncbi:MAG: sugar transferase [Putridiphycobacter sp.]